MSGLETIGPVTIGLTLSPTFVPGLNTAAEVLRAAYPEATDAELLERIFVTGICTTIDQAPRRALLITGCADPQMWYSHMVGQIVPLLGKWEEAYKSRDVGGYINRVEFADAQIVDVPA